MKVIPIITAPKPLNSKRPEVNTNLLTTDQAVKRTVENLKEAAQAGALATVAAGPVKGVIVAGGKYFASELKDAQDTARGDNTGNRGAYAPDIKDHDVRREIHEIALRERREATPTADGNVTTPTLRDLNVAVPRSFVTVPDNYED